MRLALILAITAAAVACGDTTDQPLVDQTAQPPANPDAGFEPVDDPNAPCERACPEGSWCSYGRCVMP